jgi:hypothetical protein
VGAISRIAIALKIFKLHHYRKLIRNNVAENSVFSKIPENDDGEVEVKGEFYFVKSGSTGCSVFFKRNKAIIST